MLEIHNGPLNAEAISTRWYREYKNKNCGALVSFTGIVRDENLIDGLSFDLYEPILRKWFGEWEKKLQKQNSYLLMAHSRGDVKKHESSFMAAVVSPQRKVGLSMINDFVEDFKAKAPIWKYDIIQGKRIYAKKRSKTLPNAGLLSNNKENE